VKSSPSVTRAARARALEWRRTRRVATESGTYFRQNSSWGIVTGTPMKIVVPSGRTRLVTARFTASAACPNASGDSGWPCYLRVIAKRGSNAPLVLYPRATGQAAIIASSPGYNHAVAVDRSIRLPAGTWVVSVQARSNDGSTAIYLEGWHFTLDMMT